MSESEDLTEMDMVTYSIFQTQRKETFGLAGMLGGRSVVAIPDICFDHQALQKLCDLLNTMGPSLLHIWDIVEDFCANDYQVAKTYR